MKVSYKIRIQILASLTAKILAERVMLNFSSQSQFLKTALLRKYANY